jgi:NAD(P)-dependent dehydrogenase (short-subunit alcohol dehydrogenase family)
LAEASASGVPAGGAFAGRVVVVTGAARGIGDAIVRAFAEQGGQAVAFDLLEPPEPRPGTRYVSVDVSDARAVKDAVEGVAATEGRIDVLVNNAGIQRVGPTDEMPVETWQAVIDTNLTGAFLCAAAVIPIMRGQGSGSIVQIASAAAFVGMPGRGPYSAAKAGMLGLTRELAVELAPAGIRVNAVAPGFTRTGLVDQAIADGSLNEQWMLERVPLGRLAQPDEIARVVRFLASDDASYITGQCLIVDGGWTVQGIGAAPDWIARPG